MRINDTAQIQGRIPAAKIELTRAEGPTDEVGNLATARSWEEANGILTRWAHTAPAVVGHDTCDFVITFADGNAYTGRYDLVHGSRARADLAGHVRSFVGCVSGYVKPEWMTDAGWERSKTAFFEKAAEYQAFARTYDIPGTDDWFDLAEEPGVGVIAHQAEAPARSAQPGL